MCDVLHYACAFSRSVSVRVGEKGYYTVRCVSACTRHRTKSYMDNDGVAMVVLKNYCCSMVVDRIHTFANGLRCSSFAHKSRRSLWAPVCVCVFVCEFCVCFFPLEFGGFSRMSWQAGNASMFCVVDDAAGNNTAATVCGGIILYELVVFIFITKHKEIYLFYSTRVDPTRLDATQHSANVGPSMRERERGAHGTTGTTGSSFIFSGNVASHMCVRVFVAVLCSRSQENKNRISNYIKPRARAFTINNSPKQDHLHEFDRSMPMARQRRGVNAACVCAVGFFPFFY